MANRTQMENEILINNPDNTPIKKRVVLRKIMKSLFWCFAGFAGFLGTYFMLYLLLSYFSIEKVPTKKAPITIYLMRSGSHTDIILPKCNDQVDWDKYFPIENTKSKDTTVQLLALGWGDKDFYLNTPTWGDLTAKTFLNASLGLGSSSIHATYYYYLLTDRPTVTLKLSRIQYQNLIKFIISNIKLEKKGKSIVLIPKNNIIITENDAFYDANFNYNLFYTCNTWINNCLKVAGQKACVWTPFSEGIFSQYGK